MSKTACLTYWLSWFLYWDAAHQMYTLRSTLSRYECDLLNYINCTFVSNTVGSFNDLFVSFSHNLGIIIRIYFNTSLYLSLALRVLIYHYNQYFIRLFTCMYMSEFDDSGNFLVEILDTVVYWLRLVAIKFTYKIPITPSDVIGQYLPHRGLLLVFFALIALITMLSLLFPVRSYYCSLFFFSNVAWCNRALIKVNDSYFKI